MAQRAVIAASIVDDGLLHGLLLLMVEMVMKVVRLQVMMMLLLQAQLVVLLLLMHLLLLLLLHQLLMLTKVKVERSVHAQLVLDHLVHVAILETLNGIQVEIQILRHQAAGSHDSVVV